MIKAYDVLLLSNWDIVDALVFNFVSRKLNVEDQGTKEIKGAKFSKGQATLVIWSVRKRSRTRSSQPNNIGLIGNLIVKRVEDTTNVEVAHLGMSVSGLNLATTEREKKIMFELQNKYEIFLEAYNKEVQRRIEFKNKVMG